MQNIFLHDALLRRWTAKYGEKSLKKLWRLADEMRRDNRSGLGWCYLSTDCWFQVAKAVLGHEVAFNDMTEMLHVASYGTWRLTKDIVSFDPTLYKELTESKLDGEIPFDALRCIPAWGFYVETPGMSVDGREVQGFYVRGDVNSIHMHFIAADWIPAKVNILDHQLPLLGGLTLEDELVGQFDALLASDMLDLEGVTDAQIAETRAWIVAQARDMLPALSLLLYVCKYGFPGQPSAPVPTFGKADKRGKKRGWRTEAAPAPTVRRIGVKIGAKLREAATRDQKTASLPGTHASPRPHIRHGHWHGYWEGPRGTGQKLVLHWLAPFGVALRDDGEDEVIAVPA